MDMISGLPGLFFIADDEGTSYMTGMVIAAIEPVVFLIRYDGRTRELPMELVSLKDMLDRRWEFFSSREAMEAWIGFMDSELDGPRIVTFPKKS